LVGLGRWDLVVGTWWDLAGGTWWDLVGLNSVSTQWPIRNRPMK
jgi:hypothetical protein